MIGSNFFGSPYFGQGYATPTTAITIAAAISGDSEVTAALLKTTFPLADASGDSQVAAAVIKIALAAADISGDATADLTAPTAIRFILAGISGDSDIVGAVTLLTGGDDWSPLGKNGADWAPTAVQTQPDWGRISNIEANWARNADLDALRALAPGYNSAALTYDQIGEYYDGYNATLYNEFNTRPADWSRATQTEADWSRV